MHPTSDEIRRTFIEFYKGKPGAGAVGGGAATAGGAGHAFVPSSPVVPHEDPTLLFANAGMNQFKPIFLGQADPSSPMGKLRRAVNSQKCIRAGGKHNDLEDVGKDTYHHTFFEMLGTWSFGDYFKEDSIAWGWELLTKVYKIPEDRLYVTYFAGTQGLEPDLEARSLWMRHLPSSRIIPGNMKDNFWEMGDTGPCGPCSEIHYDRIGGRDAAGLVNKGDPDVLEIWNHVFIQFNREEGGKLRALPARHVDTGMGLERLVSVLQNVRSNYDSDVFAPLFLAIERITRARKPYTGRLGAADRDNTDTAYRVIADHIRTLTFAITDGAVPSNEGRGYVLRRILRRAVRYGGQVLGAKSGFLAELVPVVVERMGEFFPELKRDPQTVARIVREEEESFGKTLARGITLFDEACVQAFTRARLIPHLQAQNATVSSSRDADGWTLAIHDAEGHELKAGIKKLRDVTPEWADAYFSPARSISSEDAFKLYDTYGFPVDLTMLMAEERGLRVDKDGFDKLMGEAKDKARAGSAGKFTGGQVDLTLPPDAVAKLRHLGVEPTNDVDKFHGRDVRATVRAIWNGEDFEQHVDAASTAHPVAVILDRTNFYAEMGGQVADTGRIYVTRATTTGRDEENIAGGGEFKVEHAAACGGYVVHVGRPLRRDLRVGDEVRLALDGPRRAAIAGNHTATHLMNLALRGALGPGADQKGSLVGPDKLRFDFAHGKPVSPEELAAVEVGVRDAVARNVEVFTELVPLERARGIKGVRAVFGEAYPDPVRVVSIGRPVADMLAEADERRAAATSVEFCGGTHVPATGAIGDFVLVGEEAVAKGVRRLTALTGVPAQAAQAAGREVASRIEAAAKLDGPILAKEAKELAAQLDALTIPLTLKHTLRARIADLQERVKQAGKQASAAKAGEVASAAKAIASSTEYDLQSFIVATVEAGSDKDALAAAINTVRAARPRHGVLLISPDADAGKLTIVAASPDVLIQRGLNAGEWVRAAAAACGGKGGGKPDMAQGGGTDLGKLRAALDAATSYAFSKVPS